MEGHEGTKTFRTRLQGLRVDIFFCRSRREEAQIDLVQRPIMSQFQDPFTILGSVILSVLLIHAASSVGYRRLHLQLRFRGLALLSGVAHLRFVDHTSSIMPKKSLTPLQWAMVILLAGPPLALVIFNIGPGRWVNTVQDSVIGGHSPDLSFLAVLLLEFILIGIVGLAVRWLTGRTLVELFTNKKSDK